MYDVIALHFTGIPLEYWREELARSCAASLGRLRRLCERRGADHGKTVEILKGAE